MASIAMSVRRAVLAVFVLSGALAGQSEFDAASIKPNLSGDGGGSVNTGRGRLNATNVSLQSLIGFAFNVRFDQLSGGPGWIGTQKYDVIAKSDSVPGGDDALRPLVKALLEDRFKLKVHTETRELPVYSLVVAKGGPKLTVHTGDKEFMQTMAPTARGMTGVSFTKAPVSALAARLGRLLGRTVVDNTGLTGEYDFTAQWPRDQSADSPGPTIPAALQEQLGLRLEAGKGPVEIVVVDGAEKASEN